MFFIKTNQRATFIGEECGSDYKESNGLVSLCELRNTKTQICIPFQKYYNATDGLSKTGRGVIPDYEITPTIIDILNNKDPEMEFALKLLKAN